MPDFDLNSIGELLSGDGLSAISKRLKVKKSDIASVLSNGIPSMLAGMQSNASTAEGEASLAHACKDHSVSDTEDIKAFLSGADLKDGKKILGHIFGDGQNDTVSELANASGLTRGKTTSILAMVAPLLLSLLGKQQNSQQQSGGGLGLASMLGGLMGGGQQSAGGLLGNLFSAGGTQDDEQSGGLLSGLLNIFH